MEIVETSIFTKLIRGLMSDGEYMELQHELLVNPLAGVGIGGGLRKLRWARGGRGKRGGARVIYYYAAPDNRIYMLLAYRKGEKDDLTPKELAQLRTLVKEHLL